MAEPTPQDSINRELPCICGNESHKACLIVGKWGDLARTQPDKVKIQIFDGDEIKTVVVNLLDLEKKLNELK